MAKLGGIAHGSTAARILSSIASTIISLRMVEVRLWGGPQGGPVGSGAQWFAPRPSLSDRPLSIPPLRHQPAALILRHIIFLDCLLDCALLIRSVKDEADELGRRPANVI